MDPKVPPNLCFIMGGGGKHTVKAPNRCFPPPLLPLRGTIHNNTLSLLLCLHSAVIRGGQTSIFNLFFTHFHPPPPPFPPPQPTSRCRSRATSWTRCCLWSCSGTRRPSWCGSTTRRGAKRDPPPRNASTDAPPPSGAAAAAVAASNASMAAVPPPLLPLPKVGAAGGAFFPSSPLWVLTPNHQSFWLLYGEGSTEVSSK